MSPLFSKFRVAAVAAIVVLPVLGIYLLSKAKWVHKELPYIGQPVAIKGANGKIEQHKIGGLELKDQHGQKVNPAEFDSCVLVANIFFASCAEVCPEMNSQVQTVAEEFAKNPRVKFLSISIDPENDSVSALKAYAKRFHADKLKWQFCTGNKTDIYDWVLNDLLLANEQRENDFIHDDKVAIIDRNGHIRAILPTRGSSNKEKLEAFKRIKEDINNLLYEYRQKDMDK
jgi:protein SCO1/2